MKKLIRRSLKAEIRKDLSDEALKQLEEAKIKIDKDAPVLEVIINSGKLDRHGEILDIKGVDLSEYKQSPVVAWSHKYDEPAIGKSLRTWKAQDGTLRSIMEFASNIYPFANLIYNLYKEKFMNAFSIGFRAEEVEEDKNGNIIYTKTKMLEYSAVLIGADPKALAVAKQMGYDTDALEMAEKGDLHIKDYQGKKNCIEVDLNGDIEHLKEMGEVIKRVIDLKEIKEENHIDKSIQVAEKALDKTKELCREGRSDKVKLLKAKAVANVLDKAVEMVIRELKEDLKGE